MAVLGGLAGLLGLAGLGGLAALLGLRGPGPRARVAEGTVRTVEAYGDGPLQRGEWWLPAPGGRGAGEGLLPTVVLVHGGYWRPGYDRSLEDAVAADLAGRGFLVWNIDYAAADSPWPATLLDVAAAHDALRTGAYADRVDPARTAVVGHSAGGHLALWLASRTRLPPGAPGAGPRAPVPALAVGQAPVAALVQGAGEGLGRGAVVALLGGTPDQVPERYAVTDPAALAPSGVPTVLLHSAADDLVPISQSEAYVRAAARAAPGVRVVRPAPAGPPARLVRVPGDHFAHLDPRSPAVAELRRALQVL